MQSLSTERLREAMRYDPETGLFYWREIRKKRTGRVGEPVGTVAAMGQGSDHKYLVIWLDGSLRRAHRLAWQYVHGYVPEGGIDHINGDTLDNRIANLRECDQRQNNGNHHRLNRHNTSGLRGVTWKRDKQKWRAYINRANRQCHLGYFDTKEAAYEAYKVAAVEHFGEFANV